MPLPIIVGGVAAAAGAAGIAASVRGGIKMKDAKKTMKAARRKQKKAIAKFENHNRKTMKAMDRLGEQELNILLSFEHFSDLIEKIQGRPEFRKYERDGIDLPRYKAKELKKISMGARVLLCGVSGAAAGTAGGFAAAGAATSAVMALGTASTGTAISALSGAAATNAVLAALGGGAIGSSASAGGMALGSVVLGGATLGVGLLVGGIIFNVTGSKLSDKADAAYAQAKKTKKQVNKITKYLRQLRKTADRYHETLSKVEEQYWKRLNMLDCIILSSEKKNWNEFSKTEQKMTENLILLVGLLYKMCQVRLVLQTEEKDKLNTVNKEVVDEAIRSAEDILANEIDGAA